MIDLLFGWLTKPYYKVTFIDSLVGGIEILLVIFCIFLIVEYIKDKKYIGCDSFDKKVILQGG